MSNFVHVNEASLRQLTSILHLTPGEAWDIGRARPFTRLEQLHAVLPEEARGRCKSLLLRKLDLNLATASELLHLAELRPFQVARLKVHQPFRSQDSLKRVQGLSEDCLRRLLEVFAVHDFEGATEHPASHLLMELVGAMR